MYTAKQRILVELTKGPKTYGELKVVTRNPKHLSNLLSQLEKEGKIAWELAPNDRRVKIYRLTEKGWNTDTIRNKLIANDLLINLLNKKFEGKNFYSELGKTLVLLSSHPEILQSFVSLFSEFAREGVFTPSHEDEKQFQLYLHNWKNAKISEEYLEELIDLWFSRLKPTASEEKAIVAETLLRVVGAAGFTLKAYEKTKNNL